MEYAVHLTNPGPLPGDPRLLCPPEWQDLLSEGPLTALYFGSEFCQDQLPGIREIERFCNLAEETGLEPVLLTPLVRSDGLSRIQVLVSELASRGRRPTVVCNDLGVLRMLRKTHPENRCRAGRLINRALRDPRLADQPLTRDFTRTARGDKIRGLLHRFGVTGMETDADLEGSYLGDGTAGLKRVLHLPYVFAASGRNCLLKAEAQKETRNFADRLGSACSCACRGGWQAEQRGDLAFPLWRGGNTLFYEAPRGSVEAHLPQADQVVVHRRPTT